MLFLIHSGDVLAADKTIKPKKDGSVEKTRITADMLIVDGNSDKAEFIGKVKAVQGTTVITSDRLNIFYQKVDTAAKDNPKEKESIKEIIATGNVKILFDDKIAITQHAVYATSTRVFTLTGVGSKITSGNNSITGSKITFFRDDGHVKIESSRSNRVEAVFESDGKGI
ncbi:LptA/OstA family protein [Desulfobacterium sp. N47]|uniref:LptA/OstA family protein n=1 Tax=Desulfobacterium sp. N47 TaxID=3115210 RepID=UPI003CB80876